MRSNPQGLRSGRTHTFEQRVVLGPLILLFTLLTMGATATAAHAEDSFRFWGFYQWNKSSWAMSMKGAAQVAPKDGAVDGWHFAVSGATPRPPRADGDFEKICGSTPAQNGMKRVAVVIDYGTAEDAPKGLTPAKPRATCTLSDEKATSAQILAKAATLRETKGQICGIDKYPTTGCGDPVKDAPKVTLPEPKVELALPPGTNGNGLPIWGVTAAALVLLIILGGFLTRRSRAKTAESTSPASSDPASGAGQE